MGMMRENAVVQMNGQAFNENDASSVIDFFTEFKWVCDSSRIQKGATVWLFWDFMSSLTLVAINVWLALSSNHANRQESTITFYTGVVDYLLRRYAIKAVVPKFDEEIWNF